MGVVFKARQRSLDRVVAVKMILRGNLASDDDLADYGPDKEGISRLGNASESFDIQALDAVELPNPPFSFVALFNAFSEPKK